MGPGGEVVRKTERLYSYVCDVGADGKIRRQKKLPFGVRVVAKNDSPSRNTGHGRGGDTEKLNTDETTTTGGK